MEVHPALRRVFDALDDGNVTWALLRGRDRLAAPTGDVDLLVEGEARSVRTALETAGSLHLRTWAGDTQQFFRAADDEGWTVILHVVSAIDFGPFGRFHTAAGPELLARRELEDGVWVLAPADEFWVTLLHGYLDKGSLAEKHRERLGSLAAVASVDGCLRAVVDRLLGSDGAARLVASVAAGRWPDADRYGATLAREWTRSQPLVARSRHARNQLSLLAAKVREPVTWPGLIVAVLAPDGAGKSTLVERLRTTLPLPVVTLYGGAYGDALTRRTVRLPGARLLSRMAILGAAGLRARWARRRRRIALFDRHPMEVERAGLRRRALRLTTPRPDLVLVLDAPTDVLLQRSDEHDAATIDRMRRRYASLADRENVEIIDADRPADLVAAAARASIWRALCARHARS